MLVSPPPSITLTRRALLQGMVAATAGTILLPSGRLWSAEVLAGGSWTSFRNGLANPGIAGSALPESLDQLWELPTPDGTASTPVIDGGRVYAATLSGDVHCIELRTGEVHWTYRSVEKVEPNSFAPGFNAPLTMDAARIYAGDDLGTLHAIDRTTGRRVWQCETGAEIVGGAQVLDDRVIFGSHEGYLYCLNAGTGETIWKVETFGPVNGTPCIAGNFTFTTGCDKPILRVIDIKAGEQTEEIPLGELLIASPAWYDGILYFGTDGGTIHALDWQKKTKVWEFSVPNREQQVQSSPAVTAEMVVIGTREKLVYGLNRRTGELKWSIPTRGRVDGSPVIAGSRVYFGAADKTLYVANLADGSVLQKIPLRQGVTGSPAIADGCLVLGTETPQGRIVCFGTK